MFDFLKVAQGLAALVQSASATYSKIRPELTETDQATIDADMQAAVGNLNAQQASVDQALTQAEQQG